METKDFESAISRIRPRMIAFAACLTDTANAEDIVQECIVSAWESYRCGKEIANCEAYLVRSIRNRCLDHIKSSAIKNRTEPDAKTLTGIADPVSPEKAAENRECVNRIRLIMQNMPFRYRTALQLRDFLGYEMDEIAQILETDEQNARKILSRARMAIREALVKR